MTNTITTFDCASYHIKYAPNSAGISVPTIYANAQTSKVFSKVSERIKQEDGIRILIESVVKEYLHLKSDKTTDGLPIPFLSLISPDFSQNLAEAGLDAIRLGEIGKQASFSILINTIISVIHGLLCGINGDLEKNLYRVRTRKILLYSNLIASTSNVIYSAISSDYSKFDIGGLLVTLYRIHSDTKFIDKIKYEFINNELSGIYKNKFEQYSFYYHET